MDKEQAFEFLCRAAEGISKMFGKYCETVVQEVSGQALMFPPVLCILKANTR